MRQYIVYTCTCDQYNIFYECALCTALSLKRLVSANFHWNIKRIMYIILYNIMLLYNIKCADLNIFPNKSDVNIIAYN